MAARTREAARKMTSRAIRDGKLHRPSECSRCGKIEGTIHAHHVDYDRHSEEAREARNAAVRAAIADGWPHARISEVTGLTRARVGQIAKTKETR